MEFLRQYFKIIGYMLLGLVFIFSSFYILANAYHYFELRKDYIANVNDITIVQDMDKNLADIKYNANTFNPSNYNGKIPANQMSLIQTNLNNCINAFNNDTIKDIRSKTRITIVDVYKLHESYSDSILSKCIVDNLNWVINIKDDYPSDYLVKSKEINKMYVQSLLSATSYLKKDLLNNSSYYYNTSISSSSVKDNTRDGFSEVIDAYYDASKYVKYISDWFRKEAGA